MANNSSRSTYLFFFCFLLVDSSSSGSWLSLPSVANKIRLILCYVRRGEEWGIRLCFHWILMFSCMPRSFNLLCCESPVIMRLNCFFSFMLDHDGVALYINLLITLHDWKILLKQSYICSNDQYTRMFSVLLLSPSAKFPTVFLLFFWFSGGF